MGYCEDEIFKALGDKLPREKIKKIVKEIEEYGISRPGITQADMLKKAMKMSEDVIEAYEWHKFNMVRNESLREPLLALADARMEAAKNNPYDATKSIMVGSDKNFDSSRDSTAIAQDKLRRELTSPVIVELKKIDALELAQSGELDVEIATELLALQSKGKLKGSGNETARKIAAIYNQAAEIARRKKNEVGINVKELSTHITKQTHDRVKLRGGALFYDVEKAYQKWRKFQLEHIDVKRTFGDAADVEKALRETYNTLLVGDIDNIDLNQSMADMGSSKHRFLHYKDGASFVANNRRYGSDTLFNSLMKTLSTDAYDVGFRERWGSNRDKMYNDVISHIANKIEDPIEKAEYLAWAIEGRGNGYMKQIDGGVRGYAGMVGLTRANIGSVIRDTFRMGYLGGAQITSFFLDGIPYVINLKKNGQNYLGAYARMLESRMNILYTSEDKRLFMDVLGAAADGAVHHPGRLRFNDFHNVPGLYSKLTYGFMKYTGSQRVMDIGRGSAQMFFSRYFAMKRTEAFANLAPEFKEQLSLYGIKEKEWAKFAEADVEVGPDGREYAIADGIKDKETQRKFGLMFSDVVDYSILSPGAKQNYFNNLGLKRGTWAGEAMRFAMQFKSFGITHLNRVGMPALRSGNALTMGHLLAASTVGGFMVLATKSFLSGKDFPDVSKPETWVRAFAIGGGLSIAGDYNMGVANYYTHSSAENFVAIAGGPGGKELAELVNITMDIIHNAVDPNSNRNVSAKIYRNALEKIPGNNMPIVRTGLDYLFLYAIQEELSPGSLRKMERNLKERTGQEFFYPPSRVAR